jgi:carbonic anhydrase
MCTDEFERSGIDWLRAVVIGLILALSGGAVTSCRSNADAETPDNEDGGKSAAAKKKAKKSKAKSDGQSADESSDETDKTKKKSKTKDATADHKADNNADNNAADKTENKKDASPSANHDAAKAISSSEALTLLKDGNAAFVNGVIKINHLTSERRASLTEEQHPFAIILSCSDSRVPPEAVFTQGLGDLFTIRVAGNIADPATVASIEYAVAHLGPQLLVVMGHTECGAVKAAIAGSHDTPSIVELVKAIQPALASLKDISNTEAAVRANITQSRAEVLRQSKLLSGLVKDKKLKVVEAVYDLKTGKVKFM